MADEKAKSAPVARGAELRRLLVRKLPTIDAKRAEGQIAVDPEALDLGADAFIDPLAALAEKKP